MPNVSARRKSRTYSLWFKSLEITEAKLVDRGLPYRIAQVRLSAFEKSLKRSYGESFDIFRNRDSAGIRGPGLQSTMYFTEDKSTEGGEHIEKG